MFQQLVSRKNPLRRMANTFQLLRQYNATPLHAVFLSITCFRKFTFFYLHFDERSSSKTCKAVASKMLLWHKVKMHLKDHTVVFMGTLVQVCIQLGIFLLGPAHQATNNLADITRWCKYTYLPCCFSLVCKELLILRKKCYSCWVWLCKQIYSWTNYFPATLDLVH